MIKRAPSRGQLARDEAFTLSCVGILLYIWMTFGGSVPLRPEGYRVKVPFAEATRLAEQADVRISGVRVGKVTGKSLRPRARRDDTRRARDRVALRAPPARHARHPAPEDAARRDLRRAQPGRPRAARSWPTAAPSAAPRSRRPSSSTRSSARSTRAPAARPLTLARRAGTGARRARPRSLNDALGGLTPFAENTDEVLRVLRSQDLSTRDLVRDTGAVLEALSERRGQLGGLVRSSDRVFRTTARRDRAARTAVQLLPALPRRAAGDLGHADDPLRPGHRSAGHPAAPRGAVSSARPWWTSERPRPTCVTACARSRRSSAPPAAASPHWSRCSTTPSRSWRGRTRSCAPPNPILQLPRALPPRDRLLLRAGRGRHPGHRRAPRPRPARALPAHHEPGEPGGPRGLSGSRLATQPLESVRRAWWASTASQAACRRSASALCGTATVPALGAGDHGRAARPDRAVRLRRRAARHRAAATLPGATSAGADRGAAPALPATRAAGRGPLGDRDRAASGCLGLRGDQIAERLPLGPVGVEVLAREPRLKPRPYRRPVVVGDGIPGCVAVAALQDHVVAKDTLEGEAKALGGAP